MRITALDNDTNKCDESIRCQRTQSRCFAFDTQTNARLCLDVNYCELPAVSQTALALNRKQSLEKRTVARQRHPQLFGRNFVRSIPLMFQIVPLL